MGGKWSHWVTVKRICCQSVSVEPCFFQKALIMLQITEVTVYIYISVCKIVVLQKSCMNSL